VYARATRRTSTHAEPEHATGRPRRTVQSYSAQAARFLGFFSGRAAVLCRPRQRDVRENGIAAPPHTSIRAALTLSRRHCRRRLPKNQGYMTSPGSALSADGEANAADPPARALRRQRGLAQAARARAAACAARARRNAPQQWLTACLLCVGSRGEKPSDRFTSNCFQHL
jgi:hypothetical protein